MVMWLVRLLMRLAEPLLHVDSDGTLRELEDLGGASNGLVADEINDKTGLTRGDTDVLGGRRDPVRVGVLSHLSVPP